MRIDHNINYKKLLYIFLIFLSLSLFFFSTNKSFSKTFDIENIDIKRPFEINFNKNEVIDDGFKEAYDRLLSLIISSNDKKKLKKIDLNKIKGMVETFTIKEEKFIDEIYYVNLGVSFNRKRVFSFLEKNNIFPSIPEKKKFLFIPVIINENNKTLLVFYDNKIYDRWDKNLIKSNLIEYILPTEDLEDINFLKKKYEVIEQYDFKEIIKKYSLRDSIVALIFKDDQKLRILSKISLNNNNILKNQSYLDVNLNNDYEVDDIIKDLKIIYEDYWKNFNQINTSIKLIINIKVDNYNNTKIANFEKALDETDLIYDYFILKFNKDFTHYQIIFNGLPNIFLEKMSNRNFSFNTQNKIWILK